MLSFVQTAKFLERQIERELARKGGEVNSFNIDDSNQQFLYFGESIIPLN